MSEAQKQPVLVVIDGNHLIHRAFHAIQAPLQTSAGEPTNAIFGFLSMLLNIIELEKPAALIVTFDEKGPTFRHDEHEGYKATRAKAPDALYAQMPRIREMLEAWRVPMCSLEGFEADDMMGTLARKAEGMGYTTYIVTGDMDALQLISEHTKVVFPHKGYREPILYDDAKVHEKYGVYPSQIVDYKALVGDTSDNIKGVQGIGPKNAVSLLSRYGTLESLYEHLSEVADGPRQKLEAGREDAIFAKRLATIVRDVPCELNPEKSALTAFNFQGLSRFLEKMEIRSLQKRLEKVIPDELRVSKEQMSLF